MESCCYNGGFGNAAVCDQGYQAQAESSKLPKTFLMDVEFKNSFLEVCFEIFFRVHKWTSNCVIFLGCEGFRRRI